MTSSQISGGSETDPFLGLPRNHRILIFGGGVVSGRHTIFDARWARQILKRFVRQQDDLLREADSASLMCQNPNVFRGARFHCQLQLEERPTWQIHAERGGVACERDFAIRSKQTGRQPLLPVWRLVRTVTGQIWNPDGLSPL